MYDPRFMSRAIALSQEALTTPGTEPFGAVVVKDGAIVGEGFNHSLVHFDPTSHGEVEALRDACRKLKT
ncbi:MAG: deaminase, partial [Rhizobacter sp.]